MPQAAYTTPNNITDNMKKWVKHLGKGIIAIFVIIVLFNIVEFFTVVGAGERGILLQFGTIKEIYQPGLHFQIPLINNVVKLDVRTQKIETEVNAASKNLQSIRTIVALNYYINPLENKFTIKCSKDNKYKNNIKENFIIYKSRKR